MHRQESNQGYGVETEAVVIELTCNVAILSTKQVSFLVILLKNWPGS